MKIRKVHLALLGLLVLGGVVAAGMTYLRSRPQSRLARARAALAEGNYGSARELAETLERTGYADEAALLRGEAAYRLARSEVQGGRGNGQTRFLEAMEELKKIKDRGVLGLEAMALVGQCQLYLKRLGDAERTLLHVLEQSSDHVEAHRALGAVYYDLGALQRAVLHFEQVARLDPKDPRPWRIIGLIYKDLSLAENAIPAYREALRRVPQEPVATEIRRELAEVLVNHTRYQEALDLLGEIPEGDNDGEVLRWRAEALWGQGNAITARETVDQALRLKPGRAPLLLLLGKMHLASGQAEEAVALLQRALQTAPHDATIHYQLALGLQTLGREREAEEHRRQAREIEETLQELTRLNEIADRNPLDREIREQMADKCERLGRSAEARMWREAAAACPLSRP